MHSNYQTYRFVLIISVCAAFLLSITNSKLVEKQEYNLEVDRQKNVLKCVGIELEGLTSESIVSKYKNLIQERVITLDGNYVNILIEDIVALENKSTGQLKYNLGGKQYLPIFEYRDNGKLQSYIVPISGKGLWSTLFGYIALSSDFNTVTGLTFYNHKETPGLGGEVEKDWFQENFRNKKIFNDNGDFKSIKVIKGIATNPDLKHKVNGISGATMTCYGVTKILYNDLKRYIPFVDLLKSNNSI